MITIIMPTYNREALLPRAIRSVLSQTFGDFELIVVDDGSTDGTESVVRTFNDKRIVYMRNEKNAGAQAARNAGIKAAKGRYIGFLDSDDEFHPEKLEKQLNAFQNCSEKTGVIHSGYRQVFESGGETICRLPHLSGKIFTKLLESPGPVFPALLVKKECFEKIGMLDETQPSYQEWDLSIRLAREYEFGYVDEPLVVYHIHTGKTISKNDSAAFMGYLRIIVKNGRDIVKFCRRKKLAGHYLILCRHARESGDPATALKFFLQSVKTFPFNPKPFAYITAAFLLKKTETRDKILYFNFKHWLKTFAG